jgi:hypothetical protein
VKSSTAGHGAGTDSAFGRSTSVVEHLGPAAPMSLQAEIELLIASGDGADAGHAREVFTRLRTALSEGTMCDTRTELEAWIR